MNRLLLLAALGAAALVACRSEAPASTPPASETISTEPKGPALPLDHPPIDVSGAKVTSRQARRLSLAQLRGSLPVVMGKDVDGDPNTWMATSTKAGLDTYARALGEPDYYLVTDENLEPSPLYAKFMDDAARDVCDRALLADDALTDASKRTLTRFVAPKDTPASNPDGFQKNLRYLKLRFHGVKVADTDTATLAPLATLFSAAAAANANAPREGWRAVCIGLLTSPEFHLY